MLLRRLPVILFGGATASSIVVLGKNDWDINSIGAIRFGRAAATFASVALDYKLSCYTRKLPDDATEVKKIWSDCHLRSANKLLKLCESNRGVFIKVGQHLGALEYLLPQEYVSTLKILHNQAPQSSLEDVFSVIREDLKSEICDLFEDFDPQILGAASLAQVYKAKLKTGETVAVKVQHRQVKAHSFVDMTTMEILVNLAGRLFPDFKLMWLADATKKNLPLELDFLHEGHNAETISKAMSHYDWLKIPKIYWKYSSERILVMEFVDGGYVNDLNYINANGISAKEVGEKLGTMYSNMIFTHGIVHCDPHPGNIIVRKNNRGKLEICLLDHGLYTQLSSEFRYNYAKLWLSIINQDVEGMKTYAGTLGVGDMYGLLACIVTARSWESLTNQKSGGIMRTRSSKEETELIKASIAQYIPQITEIFEKIPRPMVLILKTNDLLRGVETSLRIKKTMTAFLSMSKYCINAVYTEQMRLCQTRWCIFRNYLVLNWSLFRIRLFQVYLWCVSAVTFNSDEY